MTTRSRNSDASLQKTPIKLKKVENSWVLLTKDNVIEPNNPITIVTLSQPGDGSPARYLLDTVNRKIYEVVVFDEPNRSWFIGDTVKSDGRVHITSLVNPTFLILPRLIKECSSRAVPLEDLLSGDGFDQIVDFVPNLDHVADLKGPADIKAYMYNETKTLAWLERRVRKVAESIKTKNIHVLTGAVSATFVTSNKDDEHIDEEFYLKYAHGLVSQYLPDEIVDLLEKHFDFKPDLIESLSKKRKSEAEENTNKTKIMKAESFDEQKENSVSSVITNTSVKLSKPATLTAKEKARQKAASGTKTISSFFSKNSK